MKIPSKKSLGQHFLLNPVTIDKILDLAEIQKSDRVLEIGPGPGAMTERLARKAGRVVAVEKDRRFADVLRIQLTHFRNAEIVEADFLSVAVDKLLVDGRPKWKVVANLPYNVATEILFHLLEFSTYFQSFHLMVQKEVAERIAAKPGSKAYGILSVMTQIFSENKIVMKLKPGSFTPPPKVDSAVVAFKIADGCRFPIHKLETFESVVRAAFGQRRKTISNSLKGGGFSGEAIAAALKEAKISPQARAETVPIEKFAALANTLSLV